MIDMAAALEHVHESGFLHLDFKPENILVTRNASVRLVDFDLAQPKPERPKKMSRNPGTPAYMAPEQLQREGMDQRTDIFAFGVSAYEVVTLAKPFPGDTPEEILRKQLNDELIPPRELNPDIPAGPGKGHSQMPGPRPGGALSLHERGGAASGTGALPLSAGHERPPAEERV